MTNADPDQFNAVPRVGIPHNSGDGSARPIDDGRASCSNRTCFSSEQPWLPSVAVFATLLAKILALGDGAAQWSGDHASAYKKWPAFWPDVIRSTLIVLNPSSQLGELWLQSSLCFGSVGSVYAYLFISLSMCLIMSKGFFAPTAGYVDGYLGADASALAPSGFSVFIVVHRLLSVLLKAKKQVSPDLAMTSLGMHLLIESSRIVISPTPSRRQKLVAQLGQVVHKRFLPGRLAKTLGGLGIS